MVNAVFLSTVLSALAIDEESFNAEALPVTGFTAGIEGPACDAAGRLYAVAFEQAENIGRVTPEGRGDLF